MEKRLSEFSIGETGVIRLVGGDGYSRRGSVFEKTRSARRSHRNYFKGL